MTARTTTPVRMTEMYSSKKLRTEVRAMLQEALQASKISNFLVVSNIDKAGYDRFIQFFISHLATIDERESISLEVNVICPMSESDTGEYIADVFYDSIDRRVISTEAFSFCVYKDTRNRIDGTDPHTYRERLTYSIYLYERT